MLSQIASNLQSGVISLPQWESSMRGFVLEEFTTALELAVGGRQNITQSDWGYLGYLVSVQYGYLSDFANDIANNPAKWMTGGALLARMNLYADAAYAAYELFRKRHMEKLGYTQERNKLGVADHCPGCLRENRRGWVSIGALVPVGSRDCIVRCRCTIRYRKPTGRGGYTYA